MPLDGIMVASLAKELDNQLKQGRIDTVDGLNKTDFLLKIRVPGISYNLFISISYSNPTIFITQNKFQKPQVASSFTMFLRKHLEGAYIKKIYQYNYDRVIMIDIETSSELLGKEKKTLVVELMGRFANLLLLDGDHKIIEAIKQLSVLEENSRGIMKGLKYEPLKNDKLSPIDRENISKIFDDISNLNSETLINKVSGISPVLANYLINKYRYSKLDFYSFFKEEISNYSPSMMDKDYYYFNIFDKDVVSYKTISDMLYDYYIKNIEAKTLKENNIEIYRCVQTNLKRINRKLLKLENELLKDKNADDLRLKGELLLSISQSMGTRSSKITVLNYYNNEEVDIDIDPKKSIKDNSQLYYKKYKKAKSAISYIEREIELATNEKEYFELLSFQLKKASLNDLIEIKNELIENGYIKSKQLIKRQKKIKPSYMKIECDGSIIYIGKNNIQNDYITHNIAKKDDLWFHIKDGHGSHVLVVGENKYSENVIRCAAKYAAIYSSYSDSSSVPVDYTQVKYLKKVPGKKGSFVTYKNHKTIYIDPKREE